MKQLLFIVSLIFSNTALAAWVEYSTRANGDIYFYDDARIARESDQIRVWNRIRYKSSLMGASSHQSYLKLDCTEYSEVVLQSTFFSDTEWLTPAMATNMKEKPKKKIKKNSAIEQLAEIVCKE